MTSAFQEKKVLVTGATGFIGTNLVNRLIDLGAEVVGTTHLKAPQLCQARVQYTKADLTLMGDCLRVTNGIDFVFMAAANSSGAAVMDSRPLVHLTPNIVMNAQMLAAAYENGVKKFCFLSSNTVYPVTDFPVEEDDANFQFYEKYFVVGWMKRFSETMCEMYSERIRKKMSTLVVRPGNLYGPFDKFDPVESKVVAALIRRAVEKQNPFAVWGDGSDIKDFLYIDDFITGLIATFEASGDFETVNIASGVPVTVKDVLNQVLSAADHSTARVEFDPSKPTMIPKRLINIEKVKRLTGWAPSTPLDVGIRATVEWYKATLTKVL